MNLYDKTLFLQRLLYACEKTSKFSGYDDDSLVYNYKTSLKAAETEIDNAIESILYALELRGYLPAIKEI